MYYLQSTVPDDITIPAVESIVNNARYACLNFTLCGSVCCY